MSGIQCLAGQLGLFGKYPYILVPDRPSVPRRCNCTMVCIVGQGTAVKIGLSAQVGGSNLAEAMSYPGFSLVLGKKISRPLPKIVSMLCCRPLTTA